MPLTTIRRALVVAPAEEGRGGLGRSAGDFTYGLRSLGIETTYIGPQPGSVLDRAAGSRLARRFSSAPQRLLLEKGVRSAVPLNDWDFAYSVAGTAPVERSAGIVCIHQSTHHPRIEWERLKRARQATGGRSDYSIAERRRRELEIDRADLIRLTSLTVRDQFLEAGVPAHKLVHGYPGIDLGRYAPGDKSGHLRIAYVGAFSMRKGLDIAVDLANRLPVAAEVVAVGGPIDRWSRRLLDSAPFRRMDSVPQMLADAHVLILPSRSDAFANVVLEALAAGVVPIVSPEVGAAEIVRRLDPALVVELDDFAESVPELASTLDLVGLGIRARSLAQEFDRSTQAERVVRAVLEAADAC